ncbi:MAG: elongation factor G [Sulfobacillus sp.]
MADQVRHTDQLRNVVLLGHSGAGKTSLAEALLHRAGAIERRGRVEDGTTFLDTEPEEIHRHISLALSLAHFSWHGKEITLINTPGYLDFVADARVGVELADSAIVVVDAAAGVQVGTEQAVAMLEDCHRPYLFFINKADRDNADAPRVVAQLQAAFGRTVLEAMHPGMEQDLLDAADAPGHQAFMEAVLEADDDLLTRYLDGEEVSSPDLHRAMAEAVVLGTVHPVLIGSALTETGLDALCLAISDCLPPPVTEDLGGTVVRVLRTMADPFVGHLNVFRVVSGTLKADQHLDNLNRHRSERFSQLFKLHGKTKQPVSALVAGEIGAVAKLQDTTTWDTLAEPGLTVTPIAPVSFPPAQYKLAVHPLSDADEEKLSPALTRLLEEDPSLTLEHPAHVQAPVIAGYGELHLDVLVERLKRKVGVGVRLEALPVAYQETLRQTVKAEGKHKKQTGGHGQFGHVWLEVGPSSKPFEWVDKIFGGSVPLQYRPAVEKGVHEAMAEGVLAGFPVTGVKVTLVDGSDHPVDSSEMAFKLAGILAFRAASEKAQPVLLEPVMDVTVTCPEQLMGDVIGDLNRRRGRVMGMETVGSQAVVRAHVPAAELARYAIDLRSLTGGRAHFEQQFRDYEEVPTPVAHAIIQGKRAQA